MKNRSNELSMTYTEHRMAIFRAGTHTDSAGNTRDWSHADLEAIAAKYNPEHHDAPVVIGHPENNHPAFGWAKKLEVQGDTLWADTDIIPEFEEILKKGLYKKRSISLYPDGSLRHIGFLGAQPPAVKGLPDIAFSEEGITIDYEEKKEVGIMPKFWEWLKDMAKKDGVDIEIPSQFSEKDIKKQVDIEVAQKLKTEKEKLAAEFAEAQKKKDDELKAREEKLRAQEAQAHKSGIAAFCEGLLKEGKLVPAMMKHGMGITAFLEQISAIETTIEFGEGDEKKKQTPLEFMQSFLSGLPKQIEFKEVASSDKDAGRTGQAASKLETLTQEKMKANTALNYSEAFAAVQKDNPGLAAEYAEDLGR